MLQMQSPIAAVLCQVHSLPFFVGRRLSQCLKNPTLNRRAATLKNSPHVERRINRMNL
jgi:hypothetical protein